VITKLNDQQPLFQSSVSEKELFIRDQNLLYPFLYCLFWTIWSALVPWKIFSLFNSKLNKLLTTNFWMIVYSIKNKQFQTLDWSVCNRTLRFLCMLAQRFSLSLSLSLSLSHTHTHTHTHTEERSSYIYLVQGHEYETKHLRTASCVLEKFHRLG